MQFARPPRRVYRKATELPLEEGSQKELEDNNNERHFCRSSFHTRHALVGVGFPNPLDEANFAPTKSWIQISGLNRPPSGS